MRTRQPTQGQHVVVTGASRGIGAALAREFAGRGASVSLVARSRSLLEPLAAEIGGQAFPIDLAVPDRVGALVGEIEDAAGPIDVLVNNAALGRVIEFVHQSADDVTEHVHTNLLAPMLLCKAVLPAMLTRGHGHLITISSLSSEISIRNMSSYVATKAGLTSFALNLQRELRRTPVETMLVILGEVDTDMVAAGRNDPVLAAIADRLGSMGSMTPEGVAREIVDAYRRQRTTVVLPRPARPLFDLRQIPNRLFDLATRSIP
jgi:short-subunit dehydrogenase